MGKYFGTDGIRDRAFEGLLKTDAVLRYGRAFGSFAAARTPGGRVLIGRDTRDSGPKIVDLLARGLVDAGLSVVDGGVLTTPAVQTLCREERFDLAIVVSASHNPAEDNGLKLFGADGRKLIDAAEAAIEAAIEADSGGAPPFRRDGGRLVADPHLERRYVRFLRETCLPNLDLGGLPVVLDCAHGAASHLGPRLLDAFGARVVAHHAQPDGRNINREAGVFYVERLRRATLETDGGVAVALDGDADRALFLDETGALRDGDDVIGALAVDLAERDRLLGRRVVTTVMANFGLSVFLKRFGIEQETTAVGDRYVAARMAETGAVLGGEQSGHVVLRETSESGVERWFGDGLYTALRVFDAMRRLRARLADLCAGIEKFPQVLVNVRVRRKPPVETIEGLAEALRSAETELKGEGRILLRYSGTEPLLRVMVEGRDGARIRALADDLAATAARAVGAA
jgi:phosphoglucosamine mutase